MTVEVLSATTAELVATYQLILSYPNREIREQDFVEQAKDILARDGYKANFIETAKFRLKGPPS